MEIFTIALRFSEEHGCSVVMKFHIVRWCGDCSNLATVVKQIHVLYVCGKSHSGIV